MHPFSVTYKNMILPWCARQSPIIGLTYGWWIVLQQMVVQFNNRPNLMGATFRLWRIETECLTSLWFGPGASGRGREKLNGMNLWGRSLPAWPSLKLLAGWEITCTVGEGGGGKIAWRQMSGKTLNWLRAAQSTSLLYLTGDCARSRTTTNSQVGINI